MNVVLLVVDSLRAASLSGAGAPRRRPFLGRLDTEAIAFRRAYATECWTLPAHVSLFTGLLPSAHGAHFQTMAYGGEAATLAELATAEGVDTELVTRNFVFDGTVPGVTRGFARRTPVLAEASGLNPLALFLALAKPRLRRHVRATGFFHPRHRASREFVRTFARTLEPADDLALAHVLRRMRAHRQAGTPYFIFANLYDVHAPYPPREHTILRDWQSWDGWRENLAFPYAMSRLGAHRYLRAGFRITDSVRAMLHRRYEDAIDLMDHKLEAFIAAARAERLLEDAALIVTSDHGEAFGEHGLYLHDASVYDTHLHVPLWVLHPERSPEAVDDVVSMRHLFGLMRALLQGRRLDGTLLDAEWRAEHAVAVAEHFHYPHLADALPQYRQNLAAVVCGTRKAIVRGSRVEAYDLAADAGERASATTTLEDFEAQCRRDGAPPARLRRAREHLEWFRQYHGQAPEA